MRRKCVGSVALLQILSRCPYPKSQRDNLWAIFGLAKIVNASDLEASLLDGAVLDLADQWLCALRRHAVERSSRTR